MPHGQGKKIITYPRAEVRYLPQSLISDVPKIVAGLRVGQSFNAIPVPDPPVIRRGASGSFYDKGLEGASHHAVIPNVNTIDKLREVWPRRQRDQRDPGNAKLAPLPLRRLPSRQIRLPGRHCGFLMGTRKSR